MDEKVEVVHQGIPIVATAPVAAPPTTPVAKSVVAKPTAAPRKTAKGLCENCKNENCSSKYSHTYVVTESCPSYIK
ncbi:MAG: hypothetical protein WCK03_04375 [Candidatus Taylorbacteria bacterium]